MTNTLEVEKHISHVCRSCNNQLRKKSGIRHLLTLNATKTLVYTFILSKLDYCNFLLANTTLFNFQFVIKSFSGVFNVLNLDLSDLWLRGLGAYLNRQVEVRKL